MKSSSPTYTSNNVAHKYVLKCVLEECVLYSSTGNQNETAWGLHSSSPFTKSKPWWGCIPSALWVLLSWLASSGWSLWKHWPRLPGKPHSTGCQKQGHIGVTKAPLQLHFIFVFSFELGFEKLEEEWPPTPVFLPVKSHGQRSLVGDSPWGRRVGHHLAIEHIWKTQPVSYWNIPDIVAKWREL